MMQQIFVETRKICATVQNKVLILFSKILSTSQNCKSVFALHSISLESRLTVNYVAKFAVVNFKKETFCPFLFSVRRHLVV